jgi:hypothetical protein
MHTVDLYERVDTVCSDVIIEQLVDVRLLYTLNITDNLVSRDLQGNIQCS